LEGIGHCGEERRRVERLPRHTYHAALSYPCPHSDQYEVRIYQHQYCAFIVTTSSYLCVGQIKVDFGAANWDQWNAFG